jgi:nitrite reductase (NADH) large subunit
VTGASATCDGDVRPCRKFPKTCVGTDFCRFGLGDSTGLGRDMEQRYQGLDSPAKMKLAVAGCPRNCSEALVKDVGVVAVGEEQ